MKSSELKVKSSEVKAKSKWSQVKAKWSQSEVKWSQSEVKMKSKWSQSEVKIESRFPKISRKFFRFPNKHQLSIIHTVSRRSWKYGTRSVSLSISSRAQKLWWYSFWTSFWQPLVRNGRPWLQIGLGGVEKMFGWEKKIYKVLAIASSDIIFNF